MKLSGVNSINFEKVYALYGTKQQVRKLFRHMYDYSASQKTSFAICYADEFYKDNRDDEQLTQAARDGKEVAFFVTGEKDCDNVKSMKSGWDSIKAISHHICKVFDLDQMRAKDINEIESSVLNDENE